MIKIKEDYLREFVYGGIDGIITTFAVVSAVAGAGLSAGTVLILGVANLISDGLSMGVSAYLAEKSDLQQYQRKRRGVIALLEKNISGATKMVSKHLKKYGVTKTSADETAKTITANKHAVDFIMSEEHKLPDEPANPGLVGLFTFISFMLLGAVPLIPYVIEQVSDITFENTFVISISLATLAFGFIGYLKGRVTNSNLSISISETLALGLIAAIASYLISSWLESVVGA